MFLWLVITLWLPFDKKKKQLTLITVLLVQSKPIERLHITGRGRVAKRFLWTILQVRLVSQQIFIFGICYQEKKKALFSTTLSVKNYSCSEGTDFVLFV